MIAPSDPKLIGVVVLSYPPLALPLRDRALGIHHLPAPRRWNYLNRHVRTISRLILHPQFRALGLAAPFLRLACHHGAIGLVRHIDTIAAMALVHPMFERAGFIRLDDGAAVTSRSRRPRAVLLWTRPT